MTTVARPQSSQASHWYDREGNPRYEVIGKTTGKPRPTTIRDARENGWVPSVTTILKCLAAPALTQWIAEQACLAVLTTPRREGEPLDAFVDRVLHIEKVQDQEAQIARDKGIAIHDAIDAALSGRGFDPTLNPFILPAVAQITASGRVVATEKIVVGDRYAGKLDALTQRDGLLVVWDIKTTKTLPKYGSYWEHVCQTAAYSAALGNTGDDRIQTANLYVSTKEPGQIKVCTQDDWSKAYAAFQALVSYWYIANDYEL